jgi:hypothetical protein
MKTCSTCKQQKLLTEFAKRSDCKDGHAGQCKSCHVLKIYEWRKANKDKVNAIKRKYYSTEKGKTQKLKEDRAFVSSGGRARAETRRSQKPISDARKAYKTKYNLMRRSLERDLNEFNSFVLSEAVKLSRLREQTLGGNWHVDHIVPVSKGGTARADNLQVVPAVWNRQKSNLHTKRFFNE